MASQSSSGTNCLRVKLGDATLELVAWRSGASPELDAAPQRSPHTGGVAVQGHSSALCSLQGEQRRAQDWDVDSNNTLNNPSRDHPPESQRSCGDYIVEMTIFLLPTKQAETVQRKFLSRSLTFTAETHLECSPPPWFLPFMYSQSVPGNTFFKPTLFYWSEFVLLKVQDVTLLSRADFTSPSHRTRQIHAAAVICSPWHPHLPLLPLGSPNSPRHFNHQFPVLCDFCSGPWLLLWEHDPKKTKEGALSVRPFLPLQPWHCFFSF